MSLKRDILKICHEYDLGDDIRQKIEEAIDNRIGDLDRYNTDIEYDIQFAYIDNKLSMSGDWVLFEDLEYIIG